MKKRKSNMRDPVVEEVRQTKERLAAKFNYDVAAMLKDAQKRQSKGKRKVLAPTVKRTRISSSR